MRQKLFLSASALLFRLSVAAPAHAQDTAAAEALFRSAREAAEQGDWVTACDRFEESKRLEPAPGTVLNLARCRENLGQIASAWKSYTEAAQRLPVQDERHEFAKKKSLELEARVPHLILHAPETETEMVVTIDGTELSSASFGVALPFDPGTLEVVVRAPGHEESRAELVLEEGEEVTHQLALGPRSSRAGEGGSSLGASEKQPSQISGKKSALPFFIVGGVGAAAAIGGGVWAAVELKTVKDEKNCLDKRCSDVGADAAARGRVAVYLVGAGAALAAGGFGVGAYLTAKKESQVGVSPLPGGGAVFWRTEL